MNRLISSLDENTCKVIIGDFNGHVGYLGPQQKNWKGDMMLEFMNRWNLIMQINAECGG